MTTSFKPAAMVSFSDSERIAPRKFPVSGVSQIP